MQNHLVKYNELYLMIGFYINIELTSDFMKIHDFLLVTL